MPQRAAEEADNDDSSVPSSWMRPRVGRVMPEMQLSSVLLPAPFGPISPTMDPVSSANETSFRAWMPPKSTDTAQHAPQPLRHEHHDDDQQQTEHEARRILDAAQQLGNDDIEEGAEDRAADGAESSNHDHAEEGNRQADAETFRIDVAHEIGEQAAGDRSVEGADRKRRHLVARRVNPQRAGGDLAVLDDEQRAAGASAADVPRTEQADGHENEGQIVKPDGTKLISGDARRGHRQAAAAAGQAAPFEGDLLQHDAEAERCDGKIYVLQPQRRHGRERADRGGEQGAEQQRQQIGQSGPLGQDRGRIGADPEEGGVAQADLPSIAGEQIEAERDQHKDFGQREKIEDVAIEAERRCASEEQADADNRRAPAGRGPRPCDAHNVGGGAHALRTLTCPNTPSGRTVSTAIMTMKVVASAKDGET